MSEPAVELPDIFSRSLCYIPEAFLAFNESPLRLFFTGNIPKMFNYPDNVSFIIQEGTAPAVKVFIQLRGIYLGPCNLFAFYRSVGGAFRAGLPAAYKPITLPASCACSSVFPSIS